MLLLPMLSVAVRSELFRNGCGAGSSTNVPPERPSRLSYLYRTEPLFPIGNMLLA